MNMQAEQNSFFGRGNDRCYHAVCEEAGIGNRGDGGYNSATEVCIDASAVSPLGSMLSLDRYPAQLM